LLSVPKMLNVLISSPKKMAVPVIYSHSVAQVKNYSP